MNALFGTNRPQKKVAGFALAAFFCLMASRAGAATVALSNAAGATVTYETISKTDTAGSALFYPEATMRAYRGCRITEISLNLCTDTYEGEVNVFLSHSLSGQPDYVETATERGKSLTVRLSHPYEITGEPLFIGYTVTGMRYLCYSNALIDGEEWVWRNASGWARYGKIYAASLSATVEGNVLPADVRLTNAYMPEYALTDQPVDYSGTIVNLGADTVASLTVDYYADGELWGSETVAGLHIQPRESGQFSLSKFRCDEEGCPDVNFVVAKVNGRDDAIAEGNSSRVQPLLCRSSFTPRQSVIEIFSTEKCPQCPSVHDDITKALEDCPDVIEIGHHAGFYTDPFTVPSSVEYEWFYKPGNLYAPAMMIDRTSTAANLPSVYTDSVPIVSASGATASYLCGLMAQAPAFASVAIEKDFDTTSRQLQLTISGGQLLPWATPDSLRLFVMLTEDSIYTENQRGASSGYYHRHALRQSVTPTWGDAIADFAAGFSHDYAVELPSEWREEQMEIVAFVANYNSTDRNDCRILNTCKATVASHQADGITQAEAHGGMTISAGRVVAAEGELQITDLCGHTVATGHGSINLSALPPGIYIVRCGKHSQKIVL